MILEGMAQPQAWLVAVAASRSAAGPGTAPCPHPTRSPRRRAGQPSSGLHPLLDQVAARPGLRTVSPAPQRKPRSSVMSPPPSPERRRRHAHPKGLQATTAASSQDGRKLVEASARAGLRVRPPPPRRRRAQPIGSDEVVVLDPADESAAGLCEAAHPGVGEAKPFFPHHSAPPPGSWHMARSDSANLGRAVGRSVVDHDDPLPQPRRSPRCAAMWSIVGPTKPERPSWFGTTTSTSHRGHPQISARGQVGPARLRLVPQQLARLLDADQRLIARRVVGDVGPVLSRGRPARRPSRSRPRPSTQVERLEAGCRARPRCARANAGDRVLDRGAGEEVRRRRPSARRGTRAAARRPECSPPEPPRRGGARTRPSARRSGSGRPRASAGSWTRGSGTGRSGPGR